MLSAVAAAVLALANPAAAQSRPGVVTGSAARIMASAATLTGTVDSNGSVTTYFEYGTTTAYGARTAGHPAGSGTRAVTALADLAGLTPATCSGP